MREKTLRNLMYEKFNGQVDYSVDLVEVRGTTRGCVVTDAYGKPYVRSHKKDFSESQN